MAGTNKMTLSEADAYLAGVIERDEKAKEALALILANLGFVPPSRVDKRGIDIPDLLAYIEKVENVLRELDECGHGAAGTKA